MQNSQGRIRPYVINMINCHGLPVSVYHNTSGRQSIFMPATFVELAARIGFIQRVLNQLFQLLQLQWLVRSSVMDYKWRSCIVFPKMSARGVWACVWFLISMDLGYSCLDTAWVMVQCCVIGVVSNCDCCHHCSREDSYCVYNWHFMSSVKEYIRLFLLLF